MRWIIVILSIACCLMPWRMALAGGSAFELADGVGDPFAWSYSMKGLQS